MNTCVNNKVPVIEAALFLITLSFVYSLNVRAATRAKEGGAANTQTFVTYKFTDPMTNMQVFSLLVPKGWKVEGDVTWSADPALPAQSCFRF